MLSRMSPTILRKIFDRFSVFVVTPEELWSSRRPRRLHTSWLRQIEIVKFDADGFHYKEMASRTKRKPISLATLIRSYKPVDTARYEALARQLLEPAKNVQPPQ